MHALFRRASIVACAIGTLMLLGWLLKFSAYGIDFTDESFYLVWISTPYLYSASTTQFGFVYHPLYQLLGGDITALRQANILITFALAWGLSQTFLNSIVPKQSEERLLRATLSAGLATAVLLIFDTWLVTPSYNSLTLQALLITATGLLMADKPLHRASLAGWTLIGIGGWLAFMAKPSSAMALTLAVIVWLLALRRCSVRSLLLTAVSALIPLLASAWLIDGSVVTFAARIKKGIQLTQDLGGGHTLLNILRVDTFTLDDMLLYPLLATALAIFIATGLLLAKNQRWQYLSLPLSLAFFVLTASLVLGQPLWAVNLGPYQSLWIFAVMLAALVALLTIGRLKALTNITLAQWVMAVVLIVTPHMYAFGTNGNYWNTAGYAAIFWLLAGLTLVGPLIRQKASLFPLLPATLATQAMVATMLQTGLEQPYRQPQPLKLNTSTQSVNGSKLQLSEGYALYFFSAIQAARTAGLEPGTPMIDLSGQSPGILYALGAQNIGQAWLVGGYPGSLKRASEALSLVDCQTLAVSWVLWEPDGPRSLPTETLLQQGARFPDDYRQVGTWHTARGAGGYDFEREQVLFAPVNVEGTARACLAKSER
ncbi:hypothetical protein ACLPJF_07925 [Pseudomonas vlassakiae]|uniref:hypothetical protein n=1 Tax=Pseudomonas TaxID=286 RepID=UPI000C1A2B7D|nr:hypothetical protein [Pseudomonas sp. 382]AXQ49173.1 hypothetical protein DZC31_20230 [Stenotrophomonas rhizophila]PIK78027.1 hypothetical protein CQW31_13570 [Pseudomonas sp. 382]